MSIRLVSVLCFVLTLPLSIAAQQLPPDYGHSFITIGDVRNIGLDWRGVFPSEAEGRGSVGYEYRIGRTEIKTSQWVEFVNAAETAGGSAVPPQLVPLSWGARSNASTGLFEVIPGRANLPVIGTTWYTAAQYCNWLHNDKRTDIDAFQSGAYDVSTFNADNPFEDQRSRSPGARYWIPSWDEWLKAVHYDPDKNGTGEGGWWAFPNSSDTQPVPGLPGAGETSAGYDPPGVFEEFQVPLEAYPDTQSPWGLLDASGAGTEWTEEFRATGPLPRDATRVFDGQPAGPLIDFSPPFNANADRVWEFGAAEPDRLFLDTSFRVASVVPSPATGSVAAVVLISVAYRPRRRTQ
ncbi:MAG: SUMF1/EgtB/PvdO family nonheme iron enzyme [Planctomycetota bacterium]